MYPTCFGHMTFLGRDLWPMNTKCEFSALSAINALH